MSRIDQFEYRLEQQAQVLAGEVADDIVLRNGYSAPVNPLRVVELEAGLLRAGGDDFKNSFDGKLKYHSAKRKFTLLYNTKYDIGYTAGPHHPRTLFSIAHELGHYFLDRHRMYLISGGAPHGSRSEFRVQESQLEREADAFAASLLLPTHLVAPRVDSYRSGFQLIDELSRDFVVSPICATFRIVRLSRGPTAVAGIRDGKIAWMFPSDRLIQGSAYPRRGDIVSTNAQRQWELFSDNNYSRTISEGCASDWFTLFGRAAEFDDLTVQEYYLPVRLMETLVVLLTLDDDHLFGYDADSDDDDDEDYSSWSKERHDRGD